MEVVWMPGGLRTEIHLGGDDTGGAFCLLADEPPPGWTLPAHRHANESETIHIVAGEFEMEIDGRKQLIGPGETVHIPQGVSHAGTNVGSEKGRRIIVFSPAGMEGFFREAGAGSPDEQRDIAGLLRVAGSYGWRFG
jgi:quercetin dioxygenase-like cupin family protein